MPAQRHADGLERVTQLTASRLLTSEGTLYPLGVAAAQAGNGGKHLAGVPFRPPRRGVLRATIWVSGATLVLTALLALLLVGTLVFRTSVSTTTDSGGPMVVTNEPADVTGTNP